MGLFGQFKLISSIILYELNSRNLICNLKPVIAKGFKTYFLIFNEKYFISLFFHYIEALLHRTETKERLDSKKSNYINETLTLMSMLKKKNIFFYLLD